MLITNPALLYRRYISFILALADEPIIGQKISNFFSSHNFCYLHDHIVLTGKKKSGGWG